MCRGGTRDAALADMRWKLVVAALCIATPAAAAPDFVTPDRAPHPYAASPARAPLLPREDVVFLEDSADLLPTAQQQIASVAHWLRSHHTQIVVAGHADHAGDPKHNIELADQRAQRVRDQLVRDGVSRERIVLVNYGDVGAQPDFNPNDRRVVLFASTQSIDELAEASLVRGAVAVAWTAKNGSTFREVSDENMQAALHRTTRPLTARR